MAFTIPTIHTEKSSTRVVGSIGEALTAHYLEKRGDDIIERNYAKKWGEIDIISRDTNHIVHFVEVKTVSHETKGELEWAVTHETWRPEELVHGFKRKQIRRVAETWLHVNQYDGDIQFDVAALRIVPHETFATIRLIENVVITE